MIPDDFIYIKIKKILPFFRTIIFGQVSVNANNTDIAKAEFYVDGKLKETLTIEGNPGIVLGFYKTSL
ncbi:MAG: hypothetical protein KAQ84_01500 [Thermoplasmatales archaeon]|nr:hypothetical protein [Thermoplasmatales archaeon]MCK5261292.1 hypothetical protein [Thermoplasmatales archaeon]